MVLMERYVSKFSVVVLISLPTVANLLPSHASAQTFTSYPVVLSGQHAPDAGVDVEFESFSFPSISQRGDVVFRGALVGDGVDSSNGAAIYAADPDNQIRLVARTGDTASSTLGALWTSLIYGYVNDQGEVAFSGRAVVGRNPPGGSHGIWSEGGDTGLRAVAIQGLPTPDARGDETFGELPDEFLFNNAGEIAFTTSSYGSKVPGSSAPNVWSEGGGNGLDRLITRYDLVPGFDGLGDRFTSPVLNDAGETVFVTGLTNSGIGDPRDLLHGETGGQGLRTLAHHFQDAPGFNFPFDNFLNETEWSVNNAGTTVFTAQIRLSSSGAGLRTLWTENPESGLNLIAQAGDDSPGINAQFGSFSDPLISGQGHIAFRSQLTGDDVNSSNGSSVWITDENHTPTLIARAGDLAAGTSGSAYFDRFNGTTSNFDMAINARGQVAFLADLTGVGVDGSNDLGLWATDTDGELHLIARTGDLFDINPDPIVAEYREIGSIGFMGGSGGQDGRGLSFNDNGQLVMSLRFRGLEASYGVFTVNIPAPGIFICFGTAVTFLGSRRSR